MPPEAVPSNASVASTGPGIRYIGKDPMLVYAFSGMQQVSTSNVTHLSFTSGGGVILAKITFCGSVKNTEITGGNITGYTIKFNEQIAFRLKVDSFTEDMPTVSTLPVIIPPFTIVEVAGLSDNSDAGFQTSVVITGRVYE